MPPSLPLIPLVENFTPPRESYNPLSFVPQAAIPFSLLSRDKIRLKVKFWITFFENSLIPGRSEAVVRIDVFFLLLTAVLELGEFVCHHVEVVGEGELQVLVLAHLNQLLEEWIYWHFLGPEVGAEEDHRTCETE